MHLFFSTSLILMGFNFFTQAQIRETAFDLMLKGLYKNSIPTISDEELNTKAPYILLDTREKEEFEVSHIPDAKWVGYDSFDPVRLQNIAKDSTIVLYCSVGYRSERIGERLKEMGFSKVYNLYGGIFQWVNHDRKIVDRQGTETDSIHAYSKAWGIWLEKGVKVY